LLSRGLIPLLLTPPQLEARSLSPALGLLMSVEYLADARERRHAGRLFDHDAAQHVVFTLETLS
ncbi:hypothetical protein ACC719_34695, partial [Rhizobium ruizarguesonis]